MPVITMPARTSPASLDEREQMLLHARYSLNTPRRSRREVAGRIGVSEQRAHELEQRALGKLLATVARRTG